MLSTCSLVFSCILYIIRLPYMRPGDSASKRNWAAMCDEALGLVPSKFKSHEVQYLKRSKTSPPTHFTINIEDLPDPLLFEILLRLPVKSAARYKCVSRRWFALISHHTFLSRFLSLQLDKRNPLPLEPTLIFSDDKGFLATSELPKFQTGSFSLDFLPCYQSAHDNKVAGDPPVVVASCNDLVLWCTSKTLQRHYHICNPYTKQWTALPPAPQCNFQVKVGFICDPYYHYKQDVDHRSDKDSHSSIELNVDYRYAIVRILPPPLFESSGYSSELNVEIFSSKTGKWTESVVSCPPYLKFDGLESIYPAIVYKEKLYWVHEFHHSFMIGLDPFSNNNYFDVVDLPDKEWGAISVSQEGRLRLYRTLLRKGASVWELKDNDKVGAGVGKWCQIIDTLPLDRMASENPSMVELIRSSTHVAFDPSNDDILYVKSDVDDDYVIIMCNIRENTLKEVTTIHGRLTSVFRFMVPWWPTPVHKIEYNHKDMHAAHLNSCHICSELKEHQILRELKNLVKFMLYGYAISYSSAKSE